ncbi:NAD-dependent formate dehydrogenase gamma subunit [hydrothermal vent metagenome]|uniref:NAD-dependent formate dehydrogenase gamma subunit n=1 Tax=hydrothermal vent metagenome TaxID=652676 RepID=A0A3B0S1R7_9ZZZZ
MVVQTQNRVNRVPEICAGFNNQPDALLEILHLLQQQDGFLAPKVLVEIAKILNISRADIYGVVSFYDDFRQEADTGPQIKICRGEACQAQGCETLVAHVNAQTAQTFHDVYCLGNCALGPAVMIDGHLHGRVNPARFDALLTDEAD